MMMRAVLRRQANFAGMRAQKFNELREYAGRPFDSQNPPEPQKKHQSGRFQNPSVVKIANVPFSRFFSST